MTTGLLPYPEYKDSGDAWLERIPSHWSMTGLGSISRRRSDRNRPDLPLLSVLREKGVVLRSSLAEDENHNFIPDDLSNYRVAHAGDLVVNKMKAWQGSVGIAPTDGIVSPAYFVFELNGITKDYAHRLLRSRLYADYFARFSDGVRIGQWDLSIDQMKRIPVVIPPHEEQNAVVRYLDMIDLRIRRFIRNRRRLIEVLNEQKQAIIHRAVTRGLDPNAPLKPSGVEWLGDIPEYWEVKQLRFLLRGGLSNGLFKTKDKYGRGVPLVNVKDIYQVDYQVRPDALERVEASPTETVSFAVSAGDIFFVRSSLKLEGTGRCSFMNDLNEPTVYECHLVRGRPDQRQVLPRFLTYLLNSANINAALVSRANTVTMSTLPQGQIASQRLPIPPANEQLTILESIDRDCSAVISAISKAEREIDLIREYRTRLIADVVTGKLDVQHIAPQTAEAEPEDLDESIEDKMPEDDKAESVEEAAIADD